jgi:hypothetical protein
MRWHLLPAAQLAQPLPAEWAQAGTIIVMPSTDADQARQAVQLMCSRAGVSDALLLVVLDDARQGFIDIANQVFAATTSTWFGYVAQDAFAGRQWLATGLQTLTLKDKGLLAFNDGKWGGALAAFGLGRRTWLSQNYDGQLFYPGYTQHYADTELTVLAIGNAQYCYNPQAVLVEVDWGKDTKPVNALDKILFAQRKTGWLKARVKDAACLEIFK